MSFESLGLSAPVLQAVADKGYTQPTPIQEKAIPIVLMGRDVLGCAQTGTGKTASFVLPMIDILAEGRAKMRMPRSLILEPTRELAAQVAENFEIYGKNHKLNMALLIGGVSFEDQERALERGVDVLIATPGRLLDHFERGKVLLNDVKVLVIDEADRMLDMGFIPDVERIVSLLPPLRQTLFFSATMPPEIKRLADRFLSNPKEVAVSPPASAGTNIVQGLTVVPEDDKREALRQLIRSQDVKNAIVFCNRKRDVAILQGSLKKHGFNAGALHGDMSQPARMETLDRFKQGEIQILVASDVAARGLDIVDMSHVFNFDVPFSPEDYVHRIGRTGRAGKTGHSFTLASPSEGDLVQAIEKLIGNAIPRIEVPGVEAVDFEESDGRRRGRGRGRGRGPERTRAPREPRRGRAPRSEEQGQRTEEHVERVQHAEEHAPRPDRGHRAEERGHRAEGRSRRSDERAPRRDGHPADERGHRTEERGHRTEERGHRTEERGERTRRGDRRPDQRGQGSEEQAQHAERPQRERHPEGREHPRDHREDRRERRPDQRSERRHESRRDRDERAPVGLGDHVPAFLARPPR